MTDDAIRDDREPRARLRAVHPTNLRWILELSRQPAIVGRLTGEAESPSLRHGTVSRRHFEVHWDEPRGCHVGHDVGSHNGSRLDGQATGSSTVDLCDGSVLQVGDVSVVYESLPADAPTTTPTLVTRGAGHVDPGLELPTQPRGPWSSSSDGAGDPHGLYPPLPGAAPVSEALRRTVERVATESTPVLLYGERGTGKERVAREIHRLSGRHGALVVMREQAELAALVERAAAEHGTLFVDVDGLPPEAWPVLSAASTRGVRLVAALVDPSTLDPELRAIVGCEVRVPPLRDRRGDLLAWLERLYTQWLEQRPDDPVETLTLTPEAVERVLLHPWHENLRELDRLVHELASDPDLPRPIPLPRLPAWLLRGGASTATMPVPGPPTKLEQ